MLQVWTQSLQVVPMKRVREREQRKKDKEKEKEEQHLQVADTRTVHFAEDKESDEEAFLFHQQGVTTIGKLSEEVQEFC